jgi:cobalamin biosynthetic protein CobC
MNNTDTSLFLSDTRQRSKDEPTRRPSHGGRLHALSERYQIPRSEWLDLSTGIAPVAYPLSQIKAEAWHDLPDEDPEFQRCLQDYYQCRSVLAVPGSSWAIELLPTVIAELASDRPRVVCLPREAYAEHAYHWRQAGFQLSFYDDLPSHEQLAQAAACILINPNNPGGQRYVQENVQGLLDRVQAANAYLIVDEAFIEGFPGHSLAPICPQARLIVLRSVGKFFGLAGIRLGAVCAETSVLQSLERHLSPWAISGPTREAAKQALRNRAWQVSHYKWLCTASQRLEGLLERTLGRPVSNAILFVTLWLEDAPALHHYLCEQGIATRLLDSAGGVRFGLPHAESAWQRLELGLQQWSAKTPVMRPCLDRSEA